MNNKKYYIAVPFVERVWGEVTLEVDQKDLEAFECATPAEMIEKIKTREVSPWDLREVSFDTFDSDIDETFPEDAKILPN